MILLQHPRNNSNRCRGSPAIRIPFSRYPLTSTNIVPILAVLPAVIGAENRDIFPR